MQIKHRFPIGTQYIPQGRPNAKLCTVTDQLTVINSKGEIVKIYYETEHDFCGQKVKDYAVVDTTIARGLLPEYQHLLQS